MRALIIVLATTFALFAPPDLCAESSGLQDLTCEVCPGPNPPGGMGKVHRGMANLIVTVASECIERYIAPTPVLNEVQSTAMWTGPVPSNECAPGRPQTWTWRVAVSHPNQSLHVTFNGVMPLCDPPPGDGGTGQPPTFDGLVVHVDLDADSDNDAGSDQRPPDRSDPEDEVEESEPGVYLCRNEHYDEGGDPTAPSDDWERSGIVTGDPDLIRLVFEVVGAPGMATFAYDEKVLLYRADGTLIPAGAAIPFEEGEQDLLLEGIQGGLGRVEVTFLPENGKQEALDCFVFSCVYADIDVDSDNDNEFDPPDRSVVEEVIEDLALGSAFPGKLLCVNDDDDDKDGIPDFADGFDFDGDDADDDVTAEEQFVPVVIELSEGIDLEAARLRIEYEDSDPAGVVRAGAGTTDDPFVYQPAEGALRLWLKDGSVQRDQRPAAEGGDFVASAIYDDLSDLGFGGAGGHVITLYLEGIRPSADFADQRIEIRVDPNDATSDPGFLCDDAVRLTVLKVDVDTNVDGHPADGNSGMPVVSPVDEITERDDPLELVRGGYLWVNDDNDHRPSVDNVLDIDDAGYAGDDDLEPIRYDFPGPSDWPDLPEFEIHIEQRVLEGMPSIKLWMVNDKTGEITFTDGTFTASTVADLDSDADGTLYVEGVDPGVVELTLRVVRAGDGSEGEEVICEDRVRLTVFGIEKIEWIDNVDPTGAATGIMNETRPMADFAVPTGQSRSPGVRIFPDRETATDTLAHDHPLVEYTITPSVPEDSGWRVPIHLQVHDVDHYHDDTDFDRSAHSVAADGNPAGEEPNDNRTGFTGAAEGGDAYDLSMERTPSTADRHVHTFNPRMVAGDEVDLRLGFAIDADTEQPGVANSRSQGRAMYHLTHHTPGNNFRVEVGMGNTLWNRSVIDGQDIDFINGTKLIDQEHVTAVLTIWRRLYIEEDSMGAVDFKEGPADLHSWHMSPVAIGPNNVARTNINLRHDDQYVGGRAYLFRQTPAGRFVHLRTLDINGHQNGANVHFTLSAVLPAGVTHGVFTDDDVENVIVDPATGMVMDATPHPETVGPNGVIEPDTTLFNGRDMFPAACIFSDTSTLDSDDDDVLAFDLNQTQAELIPFAEMNRGQQGGDGFWVARIIYGYQGASTSSGDGRMVWLRGISVPYWHNSSTLQSVGSVAIYVETVRDQVTDNPDHAPGIMDTFSRRLRRTTLHEVGHLLGGRHGEGGLMESGGVMPPGIPGTAPDGGAFSGLSLRRFMLLKDDGPSMP